MLHDKMTKEELLTLALFDNDIDTSGGGSVEELTVTENGTYTGTEGVTYNPVNVNLPLGSKSVTANGTYTASDDSLQGYSSVTVDIDDTDLYRDTTDNTYESVKTLSNCGAFPMLSLKVGIEPVQEGSGDPSPTNIRPISGWDEANVTRCGKNLFDKTTIAENKILDSTTGEETTFYGRFSSDYIKVNPSTDYYASNVIRGSQWYCVFYYDKNKNYLSCGELPPIEDTASGVITTLSNCNYVRLVSLTTHKDDVSFVVGNQAPSSYSAYNGQSYTTALGRTVYGGTLDVVSGELKVVPYYASYNGETLEGEWISDRDVYAVGTTPTIGAQVVNIGATPTTIQLTPTQVKSLLGTTNLWADTGDIGNVRYFKKVEL